MTFHVITLFPHALDSYLKESIIKRAIEDKKIKVVLYNPRDYAENKHDRVDRKPYGGGPGMVIQALPVIKAIEVALKNISKISKKKKKKGRNQAHASITSQISSKKALINKVKIVFLSPQGKQFDTAHAKKTAQKYEHMIIVCGRYEGIDARVKKAFKMEDISVGPFVLTGGELGAMIMIDSIGRQVKGVLGDFDSLEETRAASSDVYTRPEKFTFDKKIYKVPKVLLSGNHRDIEDWRKSH